ncbi:protein SPA, chloroplastic [Senna tora]|uniref:Protein SPA, chloroplastic n=1 Tax=Senna tora TaxID=362788 RepID=A0A834WMT8_9FABA|nr:protein SPA, chloroplastic [Senna tora]
MQINKTNCIRAIEFDQNMVVAVTVGLVSVAVGIDIPVFYESQIDSALHCSLLSLQKESNKLDLQQKHILMSSKFWLDQSVPVTQHSIGEGEALSLTQSAKSLLYVDQN